jgi:hypothetical protein
MDELSLLSYESVHGWVAQQEPSLVLGCRHDLSDHPIVEYLDEVAPQPTRQEGWQANGEAAFTEAGKRLPFPPWLCHALSLLYGLEDTCYSATQVRWAIEAAHALQQ